MRNKLRLYRQTKTMGQIPALFTVMTRSLYKYIRITTDSFEVSGLYSYVFKLAGLLEIIEIVCEVDGGHYSAESEARLGVSGKDTALFL